jgi:hypothetical protein
MSWADVYPLIKFWDQSAGQSWNYRDALPIALNS